MTEKTEKKMSRKHKCFYCYSFKKKYDMLEKFKYQFNNALVKVLISAEKWPL